MSRRLDPSPSVWEQRFDVNSGYPYYVNTSTGEATWEQPYGFSENSSSAEVQSSKLPIDQNDRPS